MKIDYCLHTHTQRCGHAQGEDEEYVISALNAGIKLLGFTDHVFLPDFSQPKVRGDYSLLSDYKKSITSLKTKYKNKIKILLGFECEYLDKYESYYKDLLANGFDYLILGQHFLLNSNGLCFSCDEPHKENRKQYVLHIEKALKSGMFLYLAHPDYILMSYKRWCKSAEALCYQICELAKKYNTPIEINLNGMKWGLKGRLQYPVDQFWEIASKVGNDVVIGYDAHNPNYFEESKYINKAIRFAKKHNLKLLNRNDLLKKLA